MLRGLDRLLLFTGFCGLTATGWDLYRVTGRLRRSSEPLSALAGAGARSPAGRPHLVFFFRPGDCPRALEAIEQWNALHRAGRAVVDGVMVTDLNGPSTIQEIVGAYGLAFPVRTVPVEVVADRLRSLGARLPITLIFDERGAMHAVAPGAELEAHQADEATRVRTGDPLPAVKPRQRSRSLKRQSATLRRRFQTEIGTCLTRFGGHGAKTRQTYTRVRGPFGSCRS